MTTGYRASGLQQIVTRLGFNQADKVIYTPEIGEGPDGEPLPFFAFIDTLRIKVFLPSLTETPLPENFEDMSDGERRGALRDVLYSSPHMILDLVLQQGETEIIPASIGIVRRDPFYHFSLMTYLTDAAVWPMAAGVTMRARVRDVGWGGLDLGDQVDIFGSARTEAPRFVAPVQEINIYGGGGSGPPAPPANQVTMNGAPVTMNGEPVTMTPD